MYDFLNAYRTFPYAIEKDMLSSFVFNPPFVGEIPDSLKITEEYKSFLRYANGAVLFDLDFYGWGLVLHGVTPFTLDKNRSKSVTIPGLGEFNQQYQNDLAIIYRETSPVSYFAFGSWIADPDVMLFNIDDPNNPNAVFAHPHEERADQIKAYYSSLPEFLKDVCEKSGDRRW